MNALSNFRHRGVKSICYSLQIAVSSSHQLTMYVT